VPVAVAHAATAFGPRTDGAAHAVPAAVNGLAVGPGAVPVATLAGAEAAGAAASVAEQIGHAIQTRLESAPDEGRIDFHMSLEPPELGQVRVQLTLTNQTLSARLVAQDDATRQLIQSQMDSLRQRLQETGFGLGQIDVGGGGSRGGQRQAPLPPSPTSPAPARRRVRWPRRGCRPGP
jgi:flagellar hook-length control protein FliK